MAATLLEMLQPQVVLEMVSRLRPNNRKLSRLLGFLPDKFDARTLSLTGPATLNGQTRNFTYRIFNNTRTVATVRPGGTGPAVAPQNPMGEVTVSCARFHEKVPLNYEMLGNLSQMVGPNTVLDPGGASYIEAQSNYIADRFSEGIELMTAGMMRDSLYVIWDGDTWYPSFTAPSNPSTFGLQVDFKIPASNKNQLNMLGAGNIISATWANPATDIITQLAGIKAAFAQQHGYPMTDVIINSIMWPNLINNTGIRNAGGSSNTAFADYKLVEEKAMNGDVIDNQYYAVLRADPTIRWHIVDDVVALGGNQVDPVYTSGTASLVKYVPDTMAIFTTAPNKNIAKLYLGGEMVVEREGMDAIRRSGYHFWHQPTTQPAGIDLIGLLNAVPALFNPLAFAPATVVF